MLRINPVAAFTDNYIWLIENGSECSVIDPGDAKPVIAYLEAHQLSVSAILITHWHPDHIGGVSRLQKQFPSAPVYGPSYESSRIPQITKPLSESDQFELFGETFTVWHTPGHTLGHIVYLQGNNLYCGDTLFSAGCGRLFEGTPEQMHQSLQRIKALPDNTQVYCTHEYTLSNLEFALAVEPENSKLIEFTQRAKTLRRKDVPTLPSSIGLEKQINPFLRTDIDQVIQSAKENGVGKLPEQASGSDIFASLRSWKDAF